MVQYAGSVRGTAPVKILNRQNDVSSLKLLPPLLWTFSLSGHGLNDNDD